MGRGECAWELAKEGRDISCGGGGEGLEPREEGPTSKGEGEKDRHRSPFHERDRNANSA